MDNFEHDIPCPPDMAIRYYLWQDYFHDSDIFSIDHRWNEATLSLLCAREEAAFYDKTRGTHEERCAKCREMEDHFVYKIIFQKCKYNHYERTCGMSDYINGRFKRSALLAKIEASTGKPHYHFRIHTSDGYFEAICEKIRVKKKTGNIQEIEDRCWTANWLQMYKNGALLDDAKNLSTASILTLAESEDDLARYFALTYLSRHKSDCALQIARRYMQIDGEDVPDSRISAIWALGEFGDASDLDVLMREYNECEISFSKDNLCYCNILQHRRNIMDAIEKIQYRLNSKEMVHI